MQCGDYLGCPSPKLSISTLPPVVPASSVPEISEESGSHDIGVSAVMASGVTLVPRSRVFRV